MKKAVKTKKVLLLEPNYSNKFPPVALMKIATYYRNRNKLYGDNWEVVFYKGDLNKFVIERLADKLVNDLNEVDGVNVDWRLFKDILFDYIRSRKAELLEQLPLELPPDNSNKENHPVLKIIPKQLIVEAKDKYWKKTWQDEPEWDRVCITTLFTFYWDITIETIEFAKKLVKNQKDLKIGGVLASIQPSEIQAATGIKPHVGILLPGDFDKGDTQKIDELELDYSILDEIEYRYPMSNAFYRYTTRGCVNKCPFCAVPILEPDYIPYIPLKERIERVNNLYGEQKDLLLMDNNVLASDELPKIIQEIIDCGFYKGALFKQPNLLEKAISNLKEGINDRAYIRKSWRLINELYESLKGDESYQVYCIIEKYHISKLLTSTKENLILAYNELKDIYAYHHQVGRGKMRFVDFNQGVDARLFTPEKVELLSKIAIRPLRIAFDNIKTEKKYVEAVRMSAKAGLKDFSNYLLYNFDDHPDDLYRRLKINVDLCDELGVSIYSFPMKFHPIRKTAEMEEDYSHNRDYIGVYWNRKYIRAIQAILNSTKGKIGRGTSFFEEAFGKDINEYHKLLDMPEVMIIYRFFFKWLGTPKARIAAKNLFDDDSVCNFSTDAWWKSYQECKAQLPAELWHEVINYIHKNEFEQSPIPFINPLITNLLSFYSNHRKSVLESDTQLFKMKQVYEKNPTLEAKRHGKNKGN